MPTIPVERREGLRPLCYLARELEPALVASTAHLAPKAVPVVSESQTRELKPHGDETGGAPMRCPQYR